MFLSGFFWGMVAGSLVTQLIIYMAVRRHRAKEGAPSASHNRPMLKLPRFVDCMSGINGCENWCAHKEWVAGCERMYDYISRQLQQ